MKLNDLPLGCAAPAPQAIAIDVLLEKYAKGSESTAEDIQRRVSRALASAEQPADRERWQEEFLAALAKGFVPAGRINSAAGTGQVRLWYYVRTVYKLSVAEAIRYGRHP